MFHNRTNNNEINRIHERCLRLIYNDKRTSFEDLLKIDDSVSIHQKNVQTLAIEMYKVFKGLSPSVFSEIFPRTKKSHYELRHTSDFIIPRVKSVNYGSESVHYLGPKIWDSLPSSMKELNSLNSFKSAIKSWVPISCPCRLCKTYIHNVGYI